MINKQIPKKEDDLNFDLNFEDFYGEDDSKTTVKDKFDNVATIKNVKSKYGNSLQILEIITNVMSSLMPYSIKTKSGSRDTRDFKKHLGIIKTLWLFHKHMRGDFDRKKIERIAIMYEKAILIYSKREDNESYNFLVKIANIYEERIQIIMIETKTGLEISVGGIRKEKEMILG